METHVIVQDFVLGILETFLKYKVNIKKEWINTHL